jgi:hypothetical protein
VITTFATVGYGDIHAYGIDEFLYVMFLIMSGQLLFSFFSAKLRSAFLSSEKTKVLHVKIELIETAKLLLVRFS